MTRRFPLFFSQILSYEDLYGWTMDRIVERVGRRSNCTFCGVFRRQALDRGARIVNADRWGGGREGLTGCLCRNMYWAGGENICFCSDSPRIATGHNADDVAETVVMNVLRGDVARLKRCTEITTASAKRGKEGGREERAKCAKNCKTCFATIEKDSEIAMLYGMYI